MYKGKLLQKKLSTLLLYTLVAFIVLYSIFRLYNFLVGPIITINTPKDEQKITESTFLVSGKAKNIKNLYLNGREINIDENGNFVEELISKPPYTIVIVRGIDKYGKIKEVVLQVAKD